MPADATDGDETAPFTDIKGVGPATADRLRDLGHETPRELARAYLRGRDSREIRDRLHDVEAFHRHVRRLSFENADLGVEEHRATDLVGMLLLARERDVSPRYLVDDILERDHVGVLAADNPYTDTKVAGVDLRPGDIDWARPTVVTDDLNLSYGPYTPAPDYPRNDAVRGETIRDADGEYVIVEAGDYEVKLPRANVETAAFLTETEPFESPEEITVFEKHAPVEIERDGVNAAWVAPRIN